ncbi:MAG: hypothetical protein SF053_14090 [Bacteroidia bacterium]|nr:hypothetical protein [Bacteroidia bacterium]
MKNLTYLLLLLLPVSACRPDSPAPTHYEVDLFSPAPGQRTLYLGYTTTCDRYKQDFRLDGDTLVLEIAEENGQLYATEHFTPGSPRHAVLSDTLRYQISRTGEDLLIPFRNSSFLFFFYDNDTLHLTKGPEVDLVQENCLLMAGDNRFEGIETGICQKFEAGPLQVRNKKVVSCEPDWMGFLSISGYLIYDSQALYVSHFVYPSDTVQGWISPALAR